MSSLSSWAHSSMCSVARLSFNVELVKFIKLGLPVVMLFYIISDALNLDRFGLGFFYSFESSRFCLRIVRFESDIPV